MEERETGLLETFLERFNGINECLTSLDRSLYEIYKVLDDIKEMLHNRLD